MGAANNIKYYNVIEIKKIIGKEKCMALPFFYSFSSCDTKSGFYHYRKCSFWDARITDDSNKLGNAFLE